MISFVSISACQIKDYVGLGICQWDIDAVRIAALKLAIVCGEAWRRGGADNLVKYIGVCLDQKFGDRHFFAANGVPEAELRAEQKIEAVEWFMSIL